MKRVQRSKNRNGNGHGGARPGAGRPAGSRDKKTDQRIQELLDAGQSPLEYMLEVMRDEEASTSRRDWAAGAAAPYCHPKLQSIVRKDGSDVIPDLSQLSDAALRALAAAKSLLTAELAGGAGTRKTDKAG